MDMALRDPRLRPELWCPWALGLLAPFMVLFDGVMVSDQNASLWFMPIPVIAVLVGILALGLATKAVSAGFTSLSKRGRLMAKGAAFLWILAFGLTALQAVNPVFGFLKLTELALFAGLSLALTGFLLRGDGAFGLTLSLAFIAGIAVAVLLSALALRTGWPGGYGPLEMPGFIHIRIFAFSLALAFAAAVGVWSLVPRASQAILFGAMILFATALFWSGGRGGLLGLVAGLPVLAIVLPRLRAPLVPAALALGLGAFAAAFFPGTSAEFGMAERLAEATAGGSADALTSGRVAMWKTLGTALADAPLLGLGYGQSHWIFSAEGHGVAHLHAHNILIDAGLGLGLPGLLLATLVVLYTWGAGIAVARWSDSALPSTGMAIVTVFLILGLVDGVYFYHQGLMPLAIGVALLLAGANATQRKSEPSLPNMS